MLEVERGPFLESGGGNSAYVIEDGSQNSGRAEPARSASKRSSWNRRQARTTVEAALARAGGAPAQAAAELGLSRRALYRRIEKLSILRE